MKVSIYARESSDDTNIAPPIEEQLIRARAYCKENNFEIVKEYLDNGYSGGNWNRPEWQQLVRDAKRHLFKQVIVWAMDRIARDTEQFLWFNRNLKDAGCQVYSLNDGFINLESVGDTAKNISMAMAHEIFRKVTSEKVKRTYEAKKKEAIKKGIPLLWGRHNKEVDMNKILELRALGKGYKTIGRELGINYQLIRRRLRNTPQNLVSKNNLNQGVLN